jgi:hypothetical protein
MPATLPNDRSTHTKETGGSRKTEGFAGRNEEGMRKEVVRFLAEMFSWHAKGEPCGVKKWV